MRLTHVEEMTGHGAAWDGCRDGGTVLAGYLLDSNGLVMVTRRQDGSLAVPVALPHSAGFPRPYIDAAIEAPELLKRHEAGFAVMPQTLVLASAVVALLSHLRAQGQPEGQPS